MRWRPSGFGVASLILATVANVGAAERVGNSFDRDSWRREVVRKDLDPEVVVYPFGASPEMTAWAAESVKGGNVANPGSRLSRLQQAMFESETFDFAYDDTQTLTAEEAFSARRGNCMSFTALFIAMSRSVGIPTFLMEVRRQPEVDREDGLVIINRHVVAAHRFGGHVSIYDFNISTSTPFISGFVIDDVQASAMYHANLGGAALREDDLETALKNLEITTTLTPDWVVGWVNLGVTLAHLGDVDGAFAAYWRALEIDPKYSSALNNLSFLYTGLGREAEARVALQAATKSTDSPFTLIAMANLEMDRGDHRGAGKYLKRARRKYPGEPEVYEGLARLAMRMGEDRKVDKYRHKAERLRANAAGDR